MSVRRVLNRRQSLGFVAWAVIGAGCTAQPPKRHGAPAQPAAAPRVTPPVAPSEFAGLSDPVALSFYQQRGWRAAWTPELGAALTGSLGDARRHGLDHARFAPRTTPGVGAIRQDIGLTLTALRYARALSSGHVDPRTVERVFTLQRNEVDLAAGLEQALAGAKLADWLASLPPSDAEYQALSAAYMGSACQARPAAVSPQSAPTEAPPAGNAPTGNGPTANTSTGNAPTENIPAGKAPTETPPAVSPPSEGAPTENAPKESSPGDTTSTASAPAASPAKRLAAAAERPRQLAANLERRRWLARTQPATRIDVNTAGAFMAYVRPDADPWSARVVVGKVGHETPSIQASFRRLVANPPWRVPMDIARREIFPKGRGYLRRERMRVVGGQVVQQPGPRSALGRVKFDVQDPYDIYLHDTPSKSLFAQPERHRSHGCVRVQNAVGFARLLAGEAGRTDAFDKALASGKTREVDIGKAIPVRLLYHTAYIDEAGEVTVLADAYGWNDKLAAALGFPAAPAPNEEQPDVDVGP
ncbi:MAG TPA: L,D-transpeptidase family protein [Caulobacteraceae bacterium]|nr:L,D-transpeptidase family protein [Caulobacteraceae bacterium]